MDRRARVDIYIYNYSGSPWTHQELKTWMTTSPEPTFEVFDDSLPPASVSSTTTKLTFPEFDPCDIQSNFYADLTQLPWVLTILAVVYLIIIVLSVCGNALVILTVWRNSHMHTVTNYYIVNLAVSDLLVSVLVMPLKLLEYTSPCRWNVFGNHLLCPIISYILPIFVFASVLTLVAISLERYYAIVHPLLAMKFNSKSRTKKILAATWAIPVVLASPYTFSKSFPFVISSHMGSISRQICNDRFDEIDALMYGPDVMDRFRRGFFIFLFLIIYVIPMLVILATCVRIAVCLLQPIAVRRWPSATQKDTGRRHEENKRKVARMVIVVAVAFIVSWSPFYLSTLVSQIQSFSGHSFLRERNFLFTMLMIHLCGFLNSCINPLIYTGMSKKFRRSFKKILSGCLCCRLTHRFLRYRDSLTRGMSAAFTSSLRHSMTEVRDANDLAMSEAGSSSGAEGSHYSVRSNLNHGSLRSQGVNSSSSSIRHHHHHHQSSSTIPRRPTPQRHHNLRPEASSGSPYPESSSPKVPKPTSRGFKLWKSREQGEEVLIQLTPLKPKARKGSSCLNGDKTKECIESQHNHSSPLRSQDEERQKFIDKEPVSENEAENEEAAAGIRLLPLIPECSDQASDVCTLFHDYNSATHDARSAVKSAADTFPNGDLYTLKPTHHSDRSAAKGEDADATLKSGELISAKGSRECGVLIKNGAPRQISRDADRDWSADKTVTTLPQDKHSSVNVTQNENSKNSKHSLTSQHNAIVHAGYLPGVQL